MPNISSQDTVEQDGVLVNRSEASADKVDANASAPQSLLSRASWMFGATTKTGSGSGSGKDGEPLQNMTARDAGTWILTRTPTAFQRMMEGNYSNGFERDTAQLIRNNADPTKWSNPLEIQLPKAPSMKMYCVYGHGKETEVYTSFVASLCALLCRSYKWTMLMANVEIVLLRPG
jgi:hypothetical protein